MAKLGRPNWVYKISSPWRTIRHTWSLTGCHSGNAMSASDAEAFMTGDESPFALSFSPFLTTAGTGAEYAEYDHQVVGVAYYNGTASAPLFEVEYSSEDPAPDTLFPAGVAYASGGDSSDALPYGALEACAEFRAQIGVSKTNKPVFVRKYIHGLASGWVTTEESGAQSIALTDDGTAALEAMSNGSWYNGVSYVSPAGTSVSASAWQVIPGAHQMPRGRRKTSAKSSSADNSLYLALLKNLLAEAE
jgi:hypothetical protein